MKLFIFIEPSVKNSKLIQNIKNKFIFNNQKNFFLKHRPHITLYSFFITKNKLKHLKKITNLKFGKKIIKYETKNKTKIFKNDPILTFNTIYVPIKKNEKLLKFQHFICKYFYDYSIKYKHNKSYLQYPFIGKDWVPHYTIGSFKQNYNSKTYNSSFIEEIKKINFYYLKGHQHYLVHSMKINNDK